MDWLRVRKEVGEVWNELVRRVVGVEAQGRRVGQGLGERRARARRDENIP